MKKGLLIFGVFVLVASLIGNVYVLNHNFINEYDKPINDTIVKYDTILMSVDSFLSIQSDSFILAINKEGFIHFNVISKNEISEIVPHHVIGVSIDIWTNKDETNSDFGGLFWGFFELDTILNNNYIFKSHYVDLPDDFCPF